MIMILPYYFKLCSLPVVLIAGALLGIRRFGVRLCLLDQDSRQNEKFQFSLRSLMGLTLAVAILFSAISSCRVYYPDILNNAIDLLSVVIVALVTVWAGLGRGRTLLRILIVLFAAICVGLLSGFAIGSQYAGRTISIMVDSLIYTMLQYFFIIMPLLVVRSMGYRIVRVENTPESVDTLHT
jgi:hypothetical protein